MAFFFFSGSQYFWNIAQDTREEDHHEEPSEEKWKRLYKVVTVIVRIFVFLVALGTAVISQLSFVLVVSNIFPPMGIARTNITSVPPMCKSRMTTTMSGSSNLTQSSVSDSTQENWWRKTAGFSLRYKSNEMDVQWIWAMFLIIIAPYIFTIISRTWRWATGKQCREPGWKGVIWVMLFETLDSIGLCFMAFVLLPNIDPIAVILFSYNIAFAPGAISICCTPSTSRITVVNVIGFILQLASIGFASSYYALENRSKANVLHPLLFLVITILVSCNWYQNSPNIGSNLTKDQRGIVEKETSRVKATIRHIRGKICYLVGETGNLLSKYRVIMSCWKIFITFCFPLTLFGASCVEGEKCVQTLFGLNTNASANSILGHTLLTSNSMFGSCHYNLPMITAAVGIVCSGLCYRAVKIGFNIVAQVPCVSVPLALSPFVAVAALVWIQSRDTCSVCDLPYPQWSNDVPFASKYLMTSFYWMVIVSGICGYASFVLITLYIWKPRNVRLQTSLE